MTEPPSLVAIDRHLSDLRGWLTKIRSHGLTEHEDVRHYVGELAETLQSASWLAEGMYTSLIWEDTND